MAREREAFERELQELSQHEDAQARAISSLDGSVAVGEMSMEQEKQLKIKKRRGDREIAQEKSKLDDVARRVRFYDEAFAKIRTATGIAEIDQLVATFHKNEESNFSLFNYVAEQNTEIEKLEEAIAMLRVEAARAQALSGDASETNRHLLT
jgi:hypothetical protein